MNKIRYPLAFALSLFSLTPSAQAMTGAELLGASESLGMGYVLGATDAWLLIREGTPENFRRLTHERECLAQAKMTGRTLYRATIARVEQRPKALAEPALAAVGQIIKEMCGEPTSENP